MSLLLLLSGAPQGGQGIPPEPEPEPEVEETRGGGGQIGATRRQKRIYAQTVEYREAEDEMVILWL